MFTFFVVVLYHKKKKKNISQKIVGENVSVYGISTLFFFFFYKFLEVVLFYSVDFQQTEFE